MFQALGSVFTTKGDEMVGFEGSDEKFVNVSGRGSRGKGSSSRSNSSDRKSFGDKSADKKIDSLQNDLLVKDSIINALTARLAHLEDDANNENQLNRQHGGTKNSGTGREKSLGGGTIVHRQHVMPTTAHVVDNDGISSKKLGTRESTLTERIMNSVVKPTKTQGQRVAEKIVDIIQGNTTLHMEYLHSAKFAQDLNILCEEVEGILEEEPPVVFLQSPVYVFGDIHGNLEDLKFFSENIWKMGMDLTAGKFLFLGDYVDRGMMSLECVAYLFAVKILHPHKVVLLRGNHETRDVNGWEEHYAEKAFVRQCKDRFGPQLGDEIWEECNQAFDRLPMAAVIDHDIFCIHGGIPRPISGFGTEIQAIMALPKVAAIMPSYEHEEEWMKQVAGDCIWSDPAGEGARTGPDGFGESPRGGGAICFGHKAIDNFLAANNLSYIIRAHEAHAHGVSLSNGARLFTVFSTSKDHRQGNQAMAGCILVDNYLIQVINKSNKYKNNGGFTHSRRRSSVATSGF